MMLFAHLGWLSVGIADTALLEGRLESAHGEERVEILASLTGRLKDEAPGKAVVYGEEALRLLQSAPDRALEVTVLNDLTWACQNTGDLETALEYGESAGRLAEQLNDDEGMAVALSYIGIVNWRLGEYGLARQFQVQSLGIRDELEDRAGVAKALAGLGLALKGIGDYGGALQYQAKALNIFEELGQKRSIGQLLNNIGLVHWHLGDLDAALDHFFRSQEIFEDLGDTQSVGQTLNNIGLIYFGLHDYRKALGFFLQDLQVSEELGDKKGVAQTLNNIGGAYLQLTDYDCALEYHRRALQIFEDLGDRRGTSGALNNIGLVFSSLGDDNRALDYYLADLQICEEAGDLRGIGESLNNIAEAYLRLGRFQEALEHATRAVDIATKIEAKVLVCNAHDALANTFAALGTYDKALENHRLFKAVSDELFNEERDRRVEEIAAKYDIVRKEKEIEILERDNAIRRLEIRKQRSMRDGLLVVSLLMVGIMMLLLNRYRLKERSNREIRAKNEELTEAYEELEVVARTDPLTKLSNRLDILDKLRSEAIRFERGKRNFALILCDIDDFKGFNDRYGHSCGDSILVAVSATMTAVLRRQDSVGRWGGEEFIVLLPETDLDGGRAVSEKIREAISLTRLSCDGQFFSVSMTFGVAGYDPEVGLERCIQMADEALYFGKRNGKNQVVMA
ncbi:MAG: tetratricopeptide repeat protein [Thermoanaerobaculales bacterium]|nr:tetratricopeptide repeat protein [Thermoanaerobaculales bacterium]